MKHVLTYIIVIFDVSGKPAHFNEEETHPDWAPSLHLGHVVHPLPINCDSAHQTEEQDSTSTVQALCIEPVEG